MRLWRLTTVAAIALFATVSLARTAPAAPSAEGCLDQGGQSFVGEAVRAAFDAAGAAGYDGVSADAREVVWRLSEPRRGSAVEHYAVAFNGTGNCWLGGEITGTGQLATTAPSAVAIGVGYATSDTEIRSLTVRRTLQGVWVGPDARDVRLTDLLLSRVADTCIVAGGQGDLTVDGAFLDKCGRVVRLDSDAAGGSLTISNSLIRIDDDWGARGRGRLFDGLALGSQTTVRFEGNIVVTGSRLDANSLAVVADNCSDNTLVWLGDGDYPGDLPACFTVIDDQQAWRDARQAWLDQHADEASDDLGVEATVTCSVPSVPQSVGSSKRVGNGTAGSCTETALRNALQGGGTITFACGSLPKTIPIQSELVVANATVIDGAGKITLDGQDRTRIIRNTSQLTLKRITLARGRANVTWSGSPNGGGAVNTTYGRRLYVIDSTFRNNQTSSQGFGGAIFQAGNGALTIVRGRFESNVGGGGGGVYSLLAGLRVVNSTFLRNRGTSGSHGGGGIMSDGASANSGSGSTGGDIAVCGTTFDSNTAYATGAGAYLYAYSKDRVNVTGSTFSSNAVTANSSGVSMGGGLRFGPSPATVADSTFRRNSARSGGAIAAGGKADTRVLRSLFECNSSNFSGARLISEGNTFRPC